MQKFISFPAFLTAVIATGLMAIPTKAVPSQREKVSVIDTAETYNLDEQTTNLAASFDLGDWAQPTDAPPGANAKAYRSAYPLGLGDRTWLNTARDSPTDDLNRIIGLTGLGVGTGFIAYRLYRAYQPASTNLPYGNTNTLLLDRLSPKLRKTLLQLVHNRETANRLLTGTMLSHADRSPNWLAEKVIYDLKRDHR
ncbi:MAG TPA: hypothetical protein V6C71_06275 [Coleofasciculaceae cyanobacterium]|jgi:hypothetical protein